MNWHSVQYTSSTASTEDCLPSVVSCNYKLTPECSLSLRCASPQDRPPPPSSPWGLKGKVTSSHSHGYKLTNWWIESTRRAFNRPPPSSPPILLDHGLQVQLHPRMIPASEFILKFSRSRRPSLSLNWLDSRLQVQLQTGSIPASECISGFSWSWPPGVPPKLLAYGLQVHIQTRSITAPECIAKFNWSRPPSSHDDGLQCISKLARSCPPSASLSSLNHHLQVHLEMLWSTACSQFRYTVCRWVAI